MAKYKNKYRIESARHPHWNYEWNGVYFVTILAGKRKHLFGEVVETGAIDIPFETKLSETGEIAKHCWQEIPEHFENVELGEFVIMPNHIHGLIIITKDDLAGVQNDIVKTRHALSQDTTNQTPAQRRFQNQGRESLSSIVGSFKSAVSKIAHRKFPDFKWHPRFHDVIIHDEDSFHNHSQYIIDNPLNWFKDDYFGDEKTMK
ncbi:MAG: hypothetical protein JXR53_14545 [Bacteroidales bacterium]|nr:hypothetical protein [Bacteroidales bacterium]